ncbi:hypothetical protein SLS54_008310 [Diplodia seriata]
MVPRSTATEGILTSTAGRLCVGNLALRMMEALLALLFFASLMLYLLYLHIPRGDFGSLLAHAAVLERSSDIVEILHDTGNLSLKTLQALLVKKEYSICPTTSSIRVATHDPHSSPESSASITGYADKQESWQPIAVMWKYRMTVIALSILATATLEVVYRYSLAHSGLADVSLESYQKYAWSFVPTLTMVVFGLAFGFIDSGARTLHPFQRLNKGGVDSDVLQCDPLGTITASATFHSLKKGHFSLATILLTSLLAPALTIASSGLYEHGTVSSTQPIRLKAQNWLYTADDLVRKPSGNPSKPSESIFEAIQFNNVSYPQWTYGEFVFPMISHEGLQNRSNQSLIARLPAVRAQMNCTTYHFNDNNSEDDLEHGLSLGLRNFQVKVDRPSGCTPGQGDLLVRTYDTIWTNPLIGNPPIYVADRAYMWELLGDFEKWYGKFNCPDGLMHLWYMVGDSGTSLKATEASNLTLLHCMPYLEFVQVNVTLTLPSFQLSGIPTPDPSSARTLAGLAVDFSMPYSLQTDIKPNVFQYGSNRGNTSLDSLFQSVVFGYKGIPFEEIYGPQNVDRLIGALNSRFQEFIAQALHMNYRIPLNTSTLSSPDLPPEVASMLTNIQGTIVDDNHMRLFQNAVSTRILEGVLAAMVVCAIIHFILAPNTKILPKDPGSIAAKMSLFADSQMLAQMPEATGEPGNGANGRERLRDAFKGQTFSLGWWGGGEGGGTRRFGIDVGKADDEA